MAGVKTLATSNGLFYPQLSFMHVDFGDTEIYTSRYPFKQWLVRQSFDFIKYALMDALNRFGKALLNFSIAREA